MLPEVNLLPKYERFESRIYYFFIAGLVLLLISVGVLIYFYFTTSHALEEVETSVASLNEEKSVLETRLSSLETESDGPSIKEAVSYVEKYKLPTSKLVDEYIQLLPDYAFLSTLNFNYSSVDIQAQFDSIPATSQYLKNLTESPYLKDVIIEHASTFSHDDIGLEGAESSLEELYKVIPRYDVSYSMEINHQNLVREEEEDETAISGE